MTRLNQLFAILVLLTFSFPGWSQGTATLNIELNDVKLQELFNIIENKTEYRFFYNNDEVNVSQSVSVNVSGRTVQQTLRQAFKNLPYSFREVENKLILIEAVSKENSKQVAKQPSPRVINGKVVDAKGDPLQGVTVIVKGEQVGTITTKMGDFNLKLPDNGKELVFSFVGMRTREITITESDHFYVVLTEEAIGLNEIVVIGYGSVRKSDLTGSVAIVSTSDLNQIPSGDFSSALQGRAPGVYVAQTGSPGSAAQIRVRGIGSINQDPNPIYVIDGIITGSSSMAAINPADIESIQVLKDASAAAIYGADGANGVIIISTKRGEKGESKVSLSSFFSLNRVPKEYNVMNASQYASFYNSLLNANNNIPPLAYDARFRQWYYGDGWQTGTNWQKEITRTAPGQNHNIRISGGGENSNYSVSFNYFGEQGVLVSTSSRRFSFRGNSDFNLGNFIKVGETVSLTRSITENPSTWQGDPWQVSLIASPLMRVYNKNNKGGFEGPQITYEFPVGNGYSEYVSNTGYNDKVNPLAPLKIGDYFSYRNTILANVYVEIKPFKGLTLKSMPSVEANFNRIKEWMPAFELGVRSNGQAQLEEEFYEGIFLSWENQITYSALFHKHNFTATAVHHVRNNEGNNVDVTALGFPYEQLNVISQSFEYGRQVKGGYLPFNSESYLGRIIYDYAGKYLVTSSLRFDGNSRFGRSNRWGAFPSVSAGWKVNEDFLTDVEEITLLKFRFGWGMTGNSNIGIFQYQSVLDGFDQFSPVFGVEQQLVPALNVVHSFGNPEFKWEAAEMYNFGVDLNLFDDKIQLNAEYYIKNQNDLLVKIPVTSAYGRVAGGGDPWVNLGEVQNKGVEISGLYSKISGLFNYYISANITTINNKVKYIPGEILTDYNLTTPGYTVGSLYGYIAERIITPSDFSASGEYLHAVPATGIPKPGDLKFSDLNNDETINDLDRTIIGKAVPDFIFSLNFEAFYKNLDLSVFFYGMQNFQLYNHLRADVEGFSSQDIGHNKLVDFAMNYYREDRPSAKYVRADLYNTNHNDRPSTWYLEEGSFLRLKDVQLGYTIPRNTTNRIGLSRVRLFVNTTNLLTFTNYSGCDPESPTVGEPLSPGNDDGAYPVPRRFAFGLQVDF